MLVNEIIKKIEDNKLFTEYMFRAKNIEKLLDERDKNPFDCSWMEVSNYLKKQEIPEEIIDEIDELRELVFLTCVAFEDCGELAGYASDDIELICMADYCSFKSPWLEKMITLYMYDIFPTGDILKNYPNL